MIWKEARSRAAMPYATACEKSKALERYAFVAAFCWRYEDIMILSYLFSFSGIAYAMMSDIITYMSMPRRARAAIHAADVYAIRDIMLFPFTPLTLHTA